MHEDSEEVIVGTGFEAIFRKKFIDAHTPSSSVLRPTRSKRLRPLNLTTPPIAGASSAVATIRSAVWVMAMPATCHPGSKPSSKSAPPFPSSAASARPTNI